MARKKGSKQFSGERKNEILYMTGLGVKQCEIAKYYLMPQPTVSNIIKRGRFTRMKKNTDGRGRKIKLCNRGVRVLLQQDKQNSFKPMYSIKSTCNMFATEKLCSSSIRNYLKKYGIQYK